jgi:hypothetical protein
LVYILFEISFSAALLITVVVTFVLIPATHKARLTIEPFFTPAALV